MASSARLGPLARAVLRTQTDDRLVALVRDGTDAAFEEIVRRYRTPLVAFAAAFGPPDPEDVVQESLTRSWEALRESESEMNLKPWLYTIVRNRALNARRDARPTDQLPDGLDGVRQPPEIVLERDELERAVAAVSALPDAQRQALVRSALEGHTHAQIATAIGATPGSVRQLIYRARLAVRHGVGAVIPLPLVAAIAQAGSGGGAVAGATGGAATGGAIGGASFAGKALAVAAIGAVAAGSGVAIERAVTSEQHGQKTGASPGPSDRVTAPAPSERAPRAVADTVTPVADETSPSGGQAGGADSSGGSSSATSGSSAGSGSGSAPSSPGSSGGGGGPSGSPGSDDSGGGPGPSAQPPSGPSGSGHSGSDSSGPGGHGSDDAVSPPETEDHSGPGHGDDPAEPVQTEGEPEPVEPVEDHSGPGGDDDELDDHSGPGGPGPGPGPD